MGIVELLVAFFLGAATAGGFALYFVHRYPVQSISVADKLVADKEKLLSTSNTAVSNT